MSWDFVTSDRPKAKKVYHCGLYENLNMADIILYNRPNKKWYINPAGHIELTEEEKNQVQDYIDSGFKIKIGEVYSRTTGKYDGDFVDFCGNAAMADICRKYELYEE